MSSVSRFLKKFYSDQRHFKIINYFVILLWREPDFQTGNKYPITSSYSIYSNLLNHKNELTKFTPLSLKNKFTGPFHDVIITWKFCIKYYAAYYMAENHTAMSRCRRPHRSSIKQFFFVCAKQNVFQVSNAIYNVWRKKWWAISRNIFVSIKASEKLLSMIFKNVSTKNNLNNSKYFWLMKSWHAIK